MDLIANCGEGQRVEFKERISNIDKEMVAFANADGGSVFLGINDRGDMVGVKESNRLISRIHDIARNCDPAVKMTLHHHSGEVLEIRVPEGLDKPYRSKDGFYLRSGPNSQKLSRDEIVELLVSHGRFRFDETLNQTFRYPDDFAPAKLGNYLTLSGITAGGLATKDLLLSLDLAEETEEGFKLRQAGVMFFAKDPERFVKESYVTCVKYRGTDRLDIVDRKEVKGDLIHQIEEAIAQVDRANQTRYVISGKPRRQEIHDYPPVAIREAVINAVMHRDYFYDASHVYIHIFSDRFEIENPGGLFPGLTLEDLGKRSVRRNRLIADVLFRVGYIERIGSGIARMQKALKENGNPEMEISATNFFVLRFFKRIDKENIEQLTARQERILRYITQRGAVSKSEVSGFIGVSGDTALRELNTLLKTALINKTGRGKSTTYIPT